MTNAILNNDEIALDDLFAQIDGGLDLDPIEAVAPVEAVVEAVPAVVEEAPAVEAVVEPSVEALDLDDIDSLVAELQGDEVKVEVKPAVEADLNDGLDDLFNEDDLDLGDLAVEPVADEPTKEEVKEEPKKEAKPKAEPKPKKEASPNTARTTYYNSSKSKVLLDRLGGDTSDIVLEFSDADLSDEDLAKKQRAFLSLLNNQPTVNSDGQTVQKKVAEKVVILFTMFKQKKGWNEVMYRTFKLLLTDGYVNPKKGGNLYNDLLAKPYSPGTANAQMGQMAQMLPLLKICNLENGNLVPNEDSTILARLKAEYFPESKGE